MELLAKHVDPAVKIFRTSLENLPRSARAAFFQRRRGVRSGLPDVLITFRDRQEGIGKAVFLELKSSRGVLGPAQREVALELQASGMPWYLARTARAAMTALYREGLRVKHWRPPAQLQAWEGPFADARCKLPQHPAVRAEQLAGQRKYREQKRARRLAERAAARAEGFTASASAAQPVASEGRG